VAHNESISILRRRTAVVDPTALPESPATGGDPQAETRERLRQLITDLEALPDRQRVALVMRELSGLGYPEIGDALGASDAAARQIVYEARLALREVARGREMECDAVRRTLSERDGRILRGRLLLAHLRACEPCRDFRAAIGQRRADLRTLCPSLPMAVVWGLFAALLDEAGKAGVGAAGPATSAGIAGTGVGAAGTGAGLATTSIGSSAALKATSIAAAVTIGAGAAGVTGTVDLPPGSSGADPATAGSTSVRASPASPPYAARRARSTAHGPSHVAPNPTVGPKRHAAPAGRGPDSTSENAGATGDDGPPARGGGGTGPRQGSAEPPAGPPDWAGGNGSSNGAGAGGGPPASSPHSGSPPGLARAASHTPSLPDQAQGSPGSPPQGRGPPPGRGRDK
jgi:sigma-70-like protein